MGVSIKQRRPWEIQRAVIQALFLREVKTRFGVHRLGYLWAVLEPAAIIIVFWVMFGLHMRKHLPGIDYPMYLMTGMVSWHLFNNLVMRSMAAFEANQGLFVYRQVKPIDTLIARGIVECVVYFVVFLFFVIIGGAMGYDISVYSIPLLVVAYVGVALFGFLLGLAGAMGSYFSENVPKVVGLVLRPLFFSSGIFFTLSSVPEKFRWLLLLNPMLQWNELVRAAYFETYSAGAVSSLYLCGWVLIPAFGSLWFYARLQQRIIAS